MVITGGETRELLQIRHERYLPWRWRRTRDARCRRESLVQCDISRLATRHGRLLRLTRRIDQFVAAVFHVERFARPVDVVLLLLLVVVERPIFLHRRVLGLVDRFAPFRRRKVQRVDDAVLLQALVHLVHLLADRVDNVLLVLAPSFLVRTKLLLLATLLQADDDDARDDGDQRHGRRYGGDHDDLRDRQRSVRRRPVAQSRSAAQHRRRRRIVTVLGSLASQAGISARAEALEFVDAVHASAAVEAGPCGALVDFLAAVFSGETGLASATVVVH